MIHRKKTLKMLPSKFRLEIQNKEMAIHHDLLHDSSTQHIPMHKLWMKDAARAEQSRQKRSTKLKSSGIEESLTTTKPPIIRTKQTAKNKKKTGTEQKDTIKPKRKRVVRKKKVKEKTKDVNPPSTTTREYVDKAVGRNEDAKDVERKESIVHMAQRLDESNIPSIETQSGIFEVVKDKHDVMNSHTNVGGRTQYRRKDSLQFYKDGYEPGQSTLIEKYESLVTPNEQEDNSNQVLPQESQTSHQLKPCLNEEKKYVEEENLCEQDDDVCDDINLFLTNTKPKRRNLGFHLSLNESTMSFLGTSGMGYLEMSSGLVINKNKPDYGFHISLDDSDDHSKSAAMIKNKIFNENNDWNMEQTSPGRIQKQENTTQVDVSITTVQTSTTLTQPTHNTLHPNDNQASDISRGSTRLSFLYNEFTGFICKHCFQTNCVHMNKISPVGTPQIEHQDKSKENLQANADVYCDSPDGRDINVLLENLSERLKKDKNNFIHMDELKKLITLKKVYHEDENGNMVAYNEFVLDIDNVPYDNDITLLDETEHELANISVETSPDTQKHTQEEEEHNEMEKLENDLDLGESTLRITPNIQEYKPVVPIIRKQISDSESIKSAKDSLCYDSDYDDASYLNACALSKSNTSFEQYDVGSDVFYANIESDQENNEDEIPGTPPLISSSPRGQKERNCINIKTISKRRSQLRSQSGLETVYEAEVANHKTPNPTNVEEENQTHLKKDEAPNVTNHSTDADGLNNLLSFADELLEKSSTTDDDKRTDATCSPKITDVDGCQENNNNYMKLSDVQYLQNDDEISNTSSPSLAYIHHIPDKHCYPGLDEEDKMQLWLQDVRKQTLSEDCFSSDQENQTAEDLEVRNINHPTLHTQQEETKQTSTSSYHPSDIETPPDVNTSSYKHIDMLVLDNHNDINDDISTLADMTARTDDSGVESRITENSRTAALVIDGAIPEQDEVDNDICDDLQEKNMFQETCLFPTDHHILFQPQGPNVEIRTHKIQTRSSEENNEHYHTDRSAGKSNVYTPKPPDKPKTKSKVFKRNYSATSRESRDIFNNRSLKRPNSREDRYMKELHNVVQRQHDSYAGLATPISGRVQYTTNDQLPFLDRYQSSSFLHDNGISSERLFYRKTKENVYLPYLHNTSLPNITDYSIRGHVSKPQSIATRSMRPVQGNNNKKILHEKYNMETFLTSPLLMTSRSDFYLPSSYMQAEKMLPEYRKDNGKFK